MRATLSQTRLRMVLVVAAGAVVLVLGAKLAARLHYDPALWALAGWWVPPDLGVFLTAGSHILHGQSPYLDASSVADQFGYVYPPLLAIVISPLSSLPGSVAGMVWSLLMIACLVGALWLVGVFDWRCYLVAVLCPFTREALEYGTIDPLLVLLVAVTWRFRDRPASAATAIGAAVAAKLFLWPLALWLLITGRMRAAGLAVVATFVLILLPWAAIGFAGLMQYPELLDKASSRQGYRSYSVVALTRALGASSELAGLLSVAVGVTIIALAVWAAKDGKQSRYDQDRRSFTLALAASLALTPVVWNHYLVLLLLPIALASPRLSALWLVILAAATLDLFDWYRASPDGDLLPVAVIASLVAYVFVSAFRSTEPTPAPS